MMKDNTKVGTKTFQNTTLHFSGSAGFAKPTRLEVAYRFANIGFHKTKVVFKK